MSTAVPASLEYGLVDVFAERALQGNMLAIFADGRGLSTAQMQALARETNLSETTFVLPADDPATEREQGVRVRIFTTQEELPFAGHPTLGTASWLYWNHAVLRGADEITLLLNSGPINVRFEQPGAGKAGVFGSMRQANPVFGATHDAALVAPLLGLTVDDLDEACPVQTVSTGLPFCIVMLRTVASLQRLALVPAAAREYLATTDAQFFFCMAPVGREAGDESSGVHFRSRMQFYNGEDPATGSASGCGIAYLVRHGLVPSGQPTVFAQGVEIQRPSRIHVAASLRGEEIIDVFVAGRTIAVASGRFFQPFG